MADHFSGPRALADPASDITDVFAFPSPERPGHLVLVLDVFPIAAPTALFSDALIYRFRLRPVTATTEGSSPAATAATTRCLSAKNSGSPNIRSMFWNAWCRVASNARACPTPSFAG